MLRLIFIKTTILSRFDLKLYRGSIINQLPRSSFSVDTQSRGSSDNNQNKLQTSNKKSKKGKSSDSDSDSDFDYDSAMDAERANKFYQEFERIRR